MDTIHKSVGTTLKITNDTKFLKIAPTINNRIGVILQRKTPTETREEHLLWVRPKNVVLVELSTLQVLEAVPTLPAAPLVV
jgi:hypothetical protein